MDGEHEVSKPLTGDAGFVLARWEAKRLNPTMLEDRHRGSRPCGSWWRGTSSPCNSTGAR